MKLPTLYKKTNTGSIQEWRISVIANRIFTQFGQHEGKIQNTEDVIRDGKNIGKANETTASQQALLEAKAKWTKQKKKGYVETITDAKSNKVDKLVEGGILPMLAQSYTKHGDKIVFPCYIQPKLDGIRCIAILKNGKCTLWSRTRKPITSCPHIIKEIETSFVDDVVLDGELYNHEYRNNFEHIIHLVRQEEPCEGHESVQYHVYDIINEHPFHRRTKTIYNAFTMGNPKYSYLKRVDTLYISGTDDNFKEYVKQGYEGSVLRNSNGLYVNKRSYDLQKVKTFEDAEFDILGIEEGRGRLQGHVGSFICSTGQGNMFNVKLEGTLDYLKECFEHPKLWKGKKMTVRYQGLSNTNSVPRFPVGVAIRDYE